MLFLSCSHCWATFSNGLFHFLLFWGFQVIFNDYKYLHYVRFNIARVFLIKRKVKCYKLPIANECAFIWSLLLGGVRLIWDGFLCLGLNLVQNVGGYQGLFGYGYVFGNKGLCHRSINLKVMSILQPRVWQQHIGWSYCAISRTFGLVAWRNSNEKVSLSCNRHAAHSVEVMLQVSFFHNFTIFSPRS